MTDLSVTKLHPALALRVEMRRHSHLRSVVAAVLIGCLSGVAPIDLLGGSQVPKVDALGSQIYTACRQQGIYKTSISGGSTAEVFDPGTPIGVHATDSYLYFTGDGKVQRSALDGSGVTTLVTGSGVYASYLYGIDVDASYI